MADLVAPSPAVYLLPTGTPSECDFRRFSVETVERSQVPNFEDSKLNPLPDYGCSIDVCLRRLCLQSF
jgi:hypothetical protein